MICFEVLLNGEKLCLAGSGEDGGLQAILQHAGRAPQEPGHEGHDHPRPGPQLTVVGMHRPNPTSVAQSLWIDRFLQEGDVVSFRIVNAPRADPPEHFDVKSDAELREMQREHYRQAKARYELDQT